MRTINERRGKRGIADRRESQLAQYCQVDLSPFCHESRKCGGGGWREQCNHHGRVRCVHLSASRAARRHSAGGLGSGLQWHLTHYVFLTAVSTATFAAWFMADPVPPPRPSEPLIPY